jgi:hypothetical protein
MLWDKVKINTERDAGADKDKSIFSPFLLKLESPYIYIYIYFFFTFAIQSCRRF